MAAAAAGSGPPATACAACKYQRRRCAADCPLARYFPHDRPSVFRNAHRLFGVNNILKTLERAGPDPRRRHEAMQCVVYEAQAWDLYPSAGCVPIILGLQRRIQQAEHELRRVHADLQAYRRGGADAVVIAAQDGAAGHYYSAKAMSSSSAMGDDDEGIPAAAGAPLFMYGGGDIDEQQQQMVAMMMVNNAAVTTNDGANMLPPPQTLPWTMQQPPQYERPFFGNATTMAPQFHYQQQPIAVPTKLPELQDDDTMDYFADGINGENDEMPRESR